MKKTREEEMLYIVSKIQRLNDRLTKLNYTMTDSYSVITIFDDLNRPSDFPEGTTVAIIA